MTVYRHFSVLRMLTALARQGSAIAIPPANKYPNALQKLLNGAFAKRTFDICFSLGVLIFLSPLYLTIALID